MSSDLTGSYYSRALGRLPSDLDATNASKEEVEEEPDLAIRISWPRYGAQRDAMRQTPSVSLSSGTKPPNK